MKALCTCAKHSMYKNEASLLMQHYGSKHFLYNNFNIIIRKTKKKSIFVIKFSLQLLISLKHHKTVENMH